MTKRSSKGVFFLAPEKARERPSSPDRNKGEPPVPDWAHWRKPENRVVSLRKAVQLSLNVDLGEGEYSPEVEDRYKLALLHIENWVGKPARVGSAKVISRRFLGPGQVVTLAQVDLFYFAAWCLDAKLEVPEGFALLAATRPGERVFTEQDQKLTFAALWKNYPDFKNKLRKAFENKAKNGLGECLVVAGKRTVWKSKFEAWLVEKGHYTREQLSACKDTKATTATKTNGLLSALGKT